MRPPPRFLSRGKIHAGTAGQVFKLRVYVSTPDPAPTAREVAEAIGALAEHPEDEGADQVGILIERYLGVHDPERFSAYRASARNVASGESPPARLAASVQAVLDIREKVDPHVAFCDAWHAWSDSGAVTGAAGDQAPPSPPYRPSPASGPA